MAILGIRTNGHYLANVFWDKTEARSLTDDIAKNPFEISIVRLPKNLTIIEIIPLYPKFFLFGMVPIILGLLLGWKVVVIVGALIFSVGFLWSAPFFLLMMFLGLRKQGYKGKVSLVSYKTIIKELLKHGTS